MKNGLVITMMVFLSCGYTQEADQIASLKDDLNEAYFDQDFESIKRISDQILELDENELAGSLGLGYYWNNLDDYDSAIYYYQRANAIIPTFETYLDLAEIYRKLEKNSLRLANINNAIKYETYLSEELISEMYSNGIINTKDTSILIQSNENIALGKRAEYYTEISEFKLALKDFSSKIKWDDSGKNYFNRGLLYMALQRYDEALKDFNASLFHEIENPYKVHIRKAFVWEAQGKIQESDSLFNELRIALGENAELYYYMGKAKNLNGITENGCKYLRMAEQFGFVDEEIEKCN